MLRLFKFVAMALMLILGVVPMLGTPMAQQCVDKSGSAMMSAMSHCAMMAAMAAAADSSTALSGTHETPPCCRIVPAKPVRTTELQIPVPAAELALQPAHAVVSAMPTGKPVRGNYHAPLPDSTRSQSQLCTFLI